jgi:hypothetical protein
MSGRKRGVAVGGEFRLVKLKMAGRQKNEMCPPVNVSSCQHCLISMVRFRVCSGTLSGLGERALQPDCSKHAKQSPSWFRPRTR